MPKSRKWGIAVALCAVAMLASAASWRQALLEPKRGKPQVAREMVRVSAVQASQRTFSMVQTNRYPVMDRFNAGTGDIRTAARAPVASRRNARGTYLVLFSDAPLASYRGGIAGLTAPQSKVGMAGRPRIDVKSQASLQYVGYLQRRQQQMERQMSGMVRRSLDVRSRMQHAVNGIVTDLTPDEAARVGKIAGVRLVEPYREYAMNTDVGPTLIGAPTAWAGSAGTPGGAPGVQGEGMVIGVLDTGINFGAPSFAATDPVDGYVHVNPLGDGNFLGTCAAGGPDAGRCNNKLIGGYDFVCNAPVNGCTNASLREEPGFGDTNGHGTHTASTAAGNRRDVVFSGAPLRITGVAPRANIIAYDVCYTIVSTGQGSCPNISAVSAVDQAIADGIVDVINYSIGGGASPWTESVSLAFLAATDSGIYIAASAGNSGPAAFSLGHVEPWVSSTAAAQHGRGAFAILMQVTGPAPVPAALQPLVLNQGTGGTALAATIPGTTPLQISAGINTTSDGCAAYPANTFSGAIAVVRRGTCSFSIKTNNAAAAGAVAVVIANNQAGGIIPSVPGTTIPVFSVTQADGDALRDFGQANPATATAQISFPAVGLPNVADALGAFSSRGPVVGFNLLKPDVTAPGVSILAAVSGTTLTGSENALALYDGTSMASPHNAGSALLVRQARPSWTPSEVKSALMMTSKEAVLLEDTVTPADPFARGAGRIRVDRAIRAGLLLDETTANYQAADPATGGDPTKLNIASLANGSCFPVCEFTRTFRNPGTSTSVWRVTLEGVPGAPSTPLLVVPAGATRSVKFTIFSWLIPADGSWRFGRVGLMPRYTGGVTDPAGELHLPLAVAVQPPVATVVSPGSGNAQTGGTTNASFTIGNSGGSALDYTVSNSGQGAIGVYYADSTGINTGFRNTVYTDPATAGSQAQFAADDFDVTETTQITSLRTTGFTVSGAALTAAAVNITWSIYPDAAGLPAGNPQSNPAAAVWTYTATPTATGVTTVGSGSIRLDLVAAGQNVSLPPGKYWLVVNTRGTFANRWAHFASNTGNGSFASITVATNGTGNWASNNAFPGLSMEIRGQAGCGAPWLGTAFPASGSLFPTETRTHQVILDASGLSAATYRANLCVNSNDPVTPTLAVPITFTVVSPP